MKCYYTSEEQFNAVRKLYEGLSNVDQDALIRYIADWRLNGTMIGFKKGVMVGAIGTLGGLAAAKVYNNIKYHKKLEAEEQ